MKTNRQQIIRPGTLMMLVVIVLFGCSQPTVAQWTSGSPNINNTNSGNVGVGTTTPNLKLEVKGAPGLPSASGVTPVGITRFSQSGGTGVIDFGFGGASGAGWIQSTSSTNLGVSFDLFLNPNGGKVGIATISPGARLDLGANPVTNQFYVYNNGPAATYGMGATVANGLEVYTSTGLNKMAFGTYNQTTFTPQMVLNNGNVGIGTPSPGFRLDVVGEIRSSLGFRFADGTALTTAPLNFRSIANAAGVTQFSAGSNNDSLLFAGSGGTNVTFDPTAKKITIDATGTTGSASNISSGQFGQNTGGGAYTFPGDVTVNGVIHAKYQDLAEWVPAAHAMSAGTVVVLDQSKANQVTASTTSYDSRVAGVISEMPGLALGESGEGRVLVATTGRVRVKVDATHGPIAIGDLLVTSDVQGVAMKSEPIKVGGAAIHRPGTLIGKALEPLAKGTGEILVLLSLQ